MVPRYPFRHCCSTSVAYSSTSTSNVYSVPGRCIRPCRSTTKSAGALPSTPHTSGERGELDGAGYFAHLRRLLALDCTQSAVEDGWNAVFVGEIADTLNLVRLARDTLPCFCFTNTNAVHQQTWTAGFPRSSRCSRSSSSELGLRKPGDAHSMLLQPASASIHRRSCSSTTWRRTSKGHRPPATRRYRCKSTQDIQAALVQSGLL